MDKIFSPIKGRIIEYVNYKGITKEFFFEKTGISASNFKGSGAKSELGGEKIVSILTCFSDINSEWLILGIGQMLKKKDEIRHDSYGNTDNNISSNIQKEGDSSVTSFLQETIRDLLSTIASQQRTISNLTEKLNNRKEGGKGSNIKITG